jgi:hypothetical protein
MNAIGTLDEFTYNLRGFRLTAKYEREYSHVEG